MPMNLLLIMSVAAGYGAVVPTTTPESRVTEGAGGASDVVLGTAAAFARIETSAIVLGTRMD